MNYNNHSSESKRDTWRWVINVLISILTALATTLGASSCICDM